MKHLIEKRFFMQLFLKHEVGFYMEKEGGSLKRQFLHFHFLFPKTEKFEETDITFTMEFDPQKIVRVGSDMFDHIFFEQKWMEAVMNEVSKRESL